MNREETKQAISVMQAYVDGDEIEWRSKDFPKWETVDTSHPSFPAWEWVTVEYRTKPKPREFWLRLEVIE